MRPPLQKKIVDPLKKKFERKKKKCCQTPAPKISLDTSTIFFTVRKKQAIKNVDLTPKIISLTSKKTLKNLDRKKKRIKEWYRCYFPHRSKDSLSPVCMVFFSKVHKLLLNHIKFTTVHKNGLKWAKTV